MITTTRMNGKMPQGLKNAFDLLADMTMKQIEDYARMNPAAKCMCETKLTYCGTGCKNHDRK